MTIPAQSSPFMQPPAQDEVRPGEIKDGRYHLPHPVTGLPHKWMRTTNFIKKIGDTYALEVWDKQTLIVGLTMREDLYVEACAAVEFENEWLEPTAESKKKLTDIAARAKEVAGGNTGARMGTAFHSFTERAKRGQPHRAPRKWAGKVDVYLNALRKHYLTPQVELLERKVVNLTHNLAGTFDDAFRTVNGELVVGDTKSQKGFYSYCDPSMQLGVYANADAMWNDDTLTYEDMPAFSKDFGYVVWLPVRHDDADVRWVDIAKGYQKVRLVTEVYEWQKEGKRKNAVGGIYVAPSSLQAVEAYAKRLRDAESTEDLAQLWEEANSFGLWCPELETAGQARSWLLGQHPEIASDLVSTVDNVSTVH